MKSWITWGDLEKRLDKLKSKADGITFSPIIIDMLIAAEDHRFYKHKGVDPIALCRALWRTIFCGKREGGSTIAMQLVRVLSDRYERTIKRKLVEIYYAFRITKKLNRMEVPIYYLTIAYYGERMNGIVQLSSNLKIDIENISKHEAAEIVARIKYPEPRKCPEKRRGQIKLRTDYILRRIEECHLPISLGFTWDNGYETL